MNYTTRSLSGHVEGIFVHKNWTLRILATFGFNRTACHTVEAALDVLRFVVKDSIISRRAAVVWSPRSCDLTPFDYYLWKAVKAKCYADKPETIDDFKDNIREAIGETQLYTIDNVLKY